MFNISVDGIKLKLNASDINRANEVLEESISSDITNDQDEIIQCPKCHSEDIHSGFKSMKGTKGVLSAIVSFLFMVFPIYYKTVYKCKSCNNEFKHKAINKSV